MSDRKKAPTRGFNPKAKATAARYQRLKREILKLPGAKEAYEEGRRMAARPRRMAEELTIIGESGSEHLDNWNVKEPVIGEQSKRQEASESAVEVAQRTVGKHKRKGDKSIADELLHDRRNEVKRDR